MKLYAVVRGAWLGMTLAAMGCAGETGEPAVPAASAPALAEEVRALPDDARVSMRAPQDGELLVGPLQDGRVSVVIDMDLEGARLAHAGVMEHGTGHHHVLVDVEPIPAGEPVPFDAQHLHFGKGQAQAEVALAPGHHRLTLQFADGAHRSYGPALASSVEIWVEAAR